MRRHPARLALIVLALCLLPLGFTSAQNVPNSGIRVARRTDWAGLPKYRPDELLVRFRSGTPNQARQLAHLAVSAQSVRTWASVDGLELVQLPPGTNVQNAIVAYRQNTNVLYAEPNFIVHALGLPNDPSFAQQWGLDNTGQDLGTPGADIHAVQAWTQTTGSSNVVVAVIDTGIDYTHPDLAPNVWSNPSGYSGAINGVTITCAAGTHGFNAVAKSCDPMDDNGHGSHVSGTIGAVGNNGVGVVGVNWAVQIMSCKFLDANGSGAESDAITCLDFVKAMKDQGANVVATNNSWGGTDFSQAFVDAIRAQQQDGILFVAAAGNDSEDNDLTPFYPADYLAPNLISVAATDRFDNLAYFSDIGHHLVHIGAPGQEILSTTPQNTYTVLSGTSMAAPHVTGVAALLAAFNPRLDWRAIKNLILAGGDTLPALASTVTGKRLNAYGAMTCTNSVITNRLQPALDAIPGVSGQPITLAVLNINCAQPAGPVAVTVNPGGRTISLMDNGAGADQAAGDGIYAAQWTPPGPGNYTLTFPTGNPVEVTVLSNYSVGFSSPRYVAITGTSLDLGDDDVVKFTSPFPVKFGGGAFTNLYVSSNGTISFTNAFDNFVHQPLPLDYLRITGRPSNPLPAIEDRPVVTLVAPLWQDLVPIKGSSQNVFWGVAGTAPNRELVIEWRNVRTYECREDANATVTFEAVFSENTNDFQFNYSDVIFGGACSIPDFGNGATVGMQITQDVGTQWSSDLPTLANGTSLLWTIPPASPAPNPVPTITSVSPSVIPFGAGDTVVSINGSGFVSGSRVYTDTAFGFGDFPTVFMNDTLLQIIVSGTDSTHAQGGKFFIQVTNPAPGGGSSQGVPIVVEGATAQITSISPSSVPAGSFGFDLTINVTGYIDGSYVVFNGQGGGAPTVLNATQITIPVPDSMLSAPTTYNVQIEYSSANGFSFSNSVTLTVTAAAAPLSLGGTTAPATPNGPPRTQSKTAVPFVTQRFLGWKIAQALGPAYSSRFGRRRADLAPVASSASSGLSRMTQQVFSAAQPSTTPPPVPGFNFRPNLPADFLPSAVVTGDFNGDGKTDWAIANAGSNNIWIYLGNGDGTSRLPTIIPLRGQAPVALVAVDMNHDGKLDLVVAEADSGMVAVLLGNGDGTFKPELQFAAPGAPVSLAVADFNGDGNFDVLAGLFGDSDFGQLAFFAGDGAGKLADPLAQQNFSGPGFYYTNSIVTADLDGDGRPDIVAVDGNGGVRAYLNQGDGIFKLSQQFYFRYQSVGSFIVATAVALGDVNKDGCVDAVVMDSAGNANYFPGLCNGTFDIANERVFGAGIPAGAVLLRDVNGDGNLDLVSSAFDNNDDGDINSISIQFGDGTGNFTSPKLYRGETGMYAIAVADLNGDGFPEVLTANQDADTATVYTNDGHGGFGPPSGGYLGYVTQGQINAVSVAPTTNFAFVDVNGDGHKDLVTFENGEQIPLPGVVTVLLGNGTGNFGSPIRSPIFDNSQRANELAFGDVRNSGLLDLIMAVIDTTNNSTSYLGFAKNNGDGTFQRPALMPLTNMFPTRLALGDFNGDGKLDAMVGSLAGNSQGVLDVSVTTLLGHGEGTFSQGNTLLIASGLPNGPVLSGMIAGDFNQDGKLDLLISVSGTTIPSSANTLYELLGNGDGTFQAPKILFNNFGAYLTAVDLNHDGILDLIVAASGSVTYSSFPWTYQIYLGNADGSFRAGASYGPFFNLNGFGISTGGANDPLSATQPYVGDFNGDGNPDIAVFQNSNADLFNVNGESGSPLVTSLQILAGNGDGTFTPSGIGYTMSRLEAPQLAADVNGDGRADLVEMNLFTSSFNILSASIGPSFGVALLADPVVGTVGKLSIALAYPSSTGTTLLLSASDPNILIPVSVQIPAGGSSQVVNFQIGSAFDATRVFAITAQLGTETHVAYGTVVPTTLDAGFEAGFVQPGPPVILPSETTPDYILEWASYGGYSSIVQASCEGLPSTAACQFGMNPLPVEPGVTQLVSLVVATQPTITPGIYPFTVLLTDGLLTTRISARVNIGDFELSMSPPTQTVGVNDFTWYTVTLRGLFGYTKGIQINCGSLPTGVTCPSGVTGAQTPGPPDLGFLARTQNAVPGIYTITLIGTAGPLVHSASAQLIVTAGTFTGTASATSATISVGGSQNLNIQVNSVGGFLGQVGLSCEALQGLNCQFAPSPLAVSPNQPGTSVLTISVTTKPSMNTPTTKSAETNATR